ncbi:MAG TPA: hypothetical protein VF635_14840 [Propionibacteriaceae bacterium]
MALSVDRAGERVPPRQRHHLTVADHPDLLALPQPNPLEGP